MTDSKVADSKAPRAVATTTPPSGTLQEVKVSAGAGVLMYWPEKNGFIALFADEYRELYAEADEHSKKIAALQAANSRYTQAAVALREAQMSAVVANIKKAEMALQAAMSDMHQASADVKKKLEPLSKMDAKEGVKMVELVSLRTPKYKSKAVPVYVTSTKVSKVLAENRIYLLSGEKTKRPQEKVFKDGKLDTKEIRKRIVEKVQDQGFSKKWNLKPDDAEAYTGVLSEWARTMNGEIATFLERGKESVEIEFNLDPKDSRRKIDLSADAQLMRYTAGAGLEFNFKPFQGNLDDQRDAKLYDRVKRGLKSGELAIKANAQASFAVAEGRVRTELYLPHYAGWHATPMLEGLQFDLGYWRFYGDLILSGSAGASVAIEMDVAVSYTGGKQGIRGIPPAQKNKGAVKARTGAGSEVNAFAGVRAGVDLTGSLQWLNPEGAASAGKPAKTKPTDAVAEFKDMARVDAGVAVSTGIGIKGGLTIKHEEGRFVVYVKLGACLGVGGDATCKFVVGSETIGEFFKCIAYQLKRADFHKIIFAIEVTAFKVYCQINFLIIAKGLELAGFSEKPVEDINAEFTKAVDKITAAIRDGSQAGYDFLNRLQKTLEKQVAGWLTYAPPEVIGQFAYQISEAKSSRKFVDSDIAPRLLNMLLKAPQTMNHLNTIAERMTREMGQKQGAATGFAMIDACVAGTVYASCVSQAKQRLERAQPVSSAPFIWNSEPEFVTASLAIEHPMYAS